MNNFINNTFKPVRVFFFLLFTTIILMHLSMDLLLFKLLESRYKKEVKQLIKSGLPEDELIKLKFHKEDIKNGSTNFKWTKRNEFRYNSEMYDIIRREEVGDSLNFYCYKDIKESGLFADLERKIMEYLSGNTEARIELKTISLSLNKYFNNHPAEALLKRYYKNYPKGSSNKSTLLTGYRRSALPPPKV